MLLIIDTVGRSIGEKSPHPPMSAAFGNEHAEVVVDLVPDTRVRTAGGNFADDDGTLQHVQIVGELLRAGNGGGRGEDVNRLIGESAAGNRGGCPGLRVGTLLGSNMYSG
jgi:hypothetical protein